MSDPVRVAAGLKAAMHNPNVSEEAKANAAEKLSHLEGNITTEPTIAETKHQHHVLGGYKAVLRNDNASEEAKAHAREILIAAGYSEGHHPDDGHRMPANSTQEEHEKRVAAGYKAALSNPNVSEKAKKHAKAYLEEHNAL